MVSYDFQIFAIQEVPFVALELRIPHHPRAANKGIRLAGRTAYQCPLTFTGDSFLYDPKHFLVGLWAERYSEGRPACLGVLNLVLPIQLLKWNIAVEIIVLGFRYLTGQEGAKKMAKQKRAV